ncbi:MULTISPECIES: hypothetical protein [Leptospira]|uniref:Uncharacterized protein n=4 Tax=Leptospira kirschneri TaxID=29507 RepID=A0A1T1DIN9_9LEPT|nr:MULTISPECIES: hypothetical protein [Leptospira]EMO73789.1 hypothetical protein LEP1GSC127_1475 [Leptospira kirschneri str. 200801925]EJO70170.1 hypothetical protein LEP1GSC044_0875 [Leptospira kirschneri serovar Grippotyphosa str. RM52]EKO16490.1 hypothetical protein LEP1GSC081_2954 [Leptospira kirschneri str. H1]EKO51982.1 hypothetical protein LEP1GSC131_1241 [Leptospira kirschneri str. 200802841]EKQ83141.1 hypothetical protein LEP1GSC064_1312 [Leptospira kirschneri serovar Grippotyphosa s
MKKVCFFQFSSFILSLEEFMKKITWLTILFILLNVPAFAQNKEKGQADLSRADVFSEQGSSYTKSLQKIVRDLEATINERLTDLEKKHSLLVILRPELEKVQTIVTEDIPFTFDEGYESNLLKYVRFKFEAGKIKEVELASEKKRIQYEFAFENKRLIFSPPDVLASQVRLERFDKIENTKVADISLENQIKALRLLESSLRSSIYRIDIMIALYKDKKDRKNLYQIDI